MSAIDFGIQPLKKETASEIQSSKPKTFTFISDLLRVFGERYANRVRLQLPHKLAHKFDQLHRAYIEIQKDSDRGGKQTNALIKKYCTSGTTREQFYAFLRRRSYEIDPFPQRLVTKEKPDLETLQAVEDGRTQAFRLLFSSVIPVEKRLEVAQLYYSGVAFIHEGKKVYFSDLIEIWGSFSEANRAVKNRLFEQLGVKYWGDEKGLSNYFLKHKEAKSFEEFLILSSIDALERNLNLKFSDALRADFFQLFENESIRSDVCYFTSDLCHFYETDFQTFKRPSSKMLVSLQVYLFFCRCYGVSVQKQSMLLRIILHRSSEWDLGELVWFKQRSWGHKVAQKESVDFSQAWREFDELMRLLPDQAMKSPWCLPLFHLVWNSRSCDTIFSFFCTLAKDPRFSLSVSVIYLFCQKNYASFTENHSQRLARAYSKVLQIFDQKEIKITAAQAIFLDPPIDLANDISLFGASEIDTARFVNGLSSFAGPFGNEVLPLLRNYLLNPTDLIFDLLKDAPSLGIKGYSSEFLQEVLSVHHPIFNRLVIYPKYICERAKEIFGKYLSDYNFSDVQAFFLYLECISLCLEKKEFMIAYYRQVVDEFEKLGQPLNRQDIYFLFLYRPEIDLTGPKNISQLQEAIFHFEELSPSLIDQDVRASIVHQIGQFVALVAEACPDEHEQVRFTVSLHHSLASSFFAPLQPLADHFRIKGLSPEGGVEWKINEMKSHLGQLKPIFKGSLISVYFHWFIIDDEPVLFFSFYHLEKRTAHSAFVKLSVSAKAIEGTVFFDALLDLSQRFFKDEDPFLPQSPEEMKPWRETFEKAGLPAEYFDKLCHFNYQVKVSYQNYYLAAVSGRQFKLPFTNPVDASEDFIKKEILPLFCLPTQKNELLKFPLKTSLDEKSQPIGYCVQSAEQVNGEIVDEERQKSLHENGLQNEMGGAYVTLVAIDTGCKVPLRYPPEVLKDPDSFLRYLEYHNLVLKAMLHFLEDFRKRSF